MIVNTICFSLPIGLVLDFLFGDPVYPWHPIRLIGHLIRYTEKFARALFPSTKRGEILAGIFLVIVVTLIPTALCFLLIWAISKISMVLVVILQALLFYQLIAVRDLQKHAKKVYGYLSQDQLPNARNAVSMIVGRDTESLTEEEVTKATIETVAENLADGVVSPIFYMAIGGAPLVVFFKAVSTMDSMVGYNNPTYQYVGRAAAKLDDVLNFIPARVAAFLLILASFFTTENTKNAWRIFKRDRFRHKSPNSAQTEAAMAGALGIQLGGNATYFGIQQEKPTIGDALRPALPIDICRAVRLMIQASLWAGLYGSLLAFLIYTI